MMEMTKCCFCLKLRTGSLIIAGIYLLLGCLFFFEESLHAISRVKYMTEEQKLTVSFFYDLSPCVMIVLGISTLYGSVKANPLYLYAGIPLTVLLVSVNCYSLFIAFVYACLYAFNVTPVNVDQLMQQGLSTVFLFYFLFILRGHYNEIAKVKKGTFQSIGSVRCVDEPNELE